MSETQLHASPTIRNFRTVGAGGQLAISTVKDSLTPVCHLPVTQAELEQIVKASKGLQKGGDNARD
jgi:hypothetical protein